ncbi:flagellar hook-associated protein 2 [Thermosulfidibacter takaii ABI70S6]|uniref:Flagellar hook-associated protein 2 n=1 Tax=Thermosulfidibacter takaii (strain DSM 17441 / JCM 13301 / NBRC 103674 / ABI70S6) TaxID=1298851 RepID=A0A0S3QSV1_THET7|nr:flagellar filament capping protein FliD [Thermosulfidibacter takaii]BAT71391.1 flagellar hook-associated protein 2 [Thermosulfidibacter takaii ABI70S6]
MSDLRVAGLISGIDVNGIIQELVRARSGVLEQLEAKEDKLKIEKDTYKEIADMVDDLKNSLLKLRLQSTYMNKMVTSSNEAVLTATADVNSSFGKHRIKVLQLANPAMAFSTFARARLVNAGTTGVDSVSGRPEETVEGTDRIRIYQDADTGKYFATDNFYVKGKNQLASYIGDVAEDTTNEGKIASDMAQGSAINFTYGGQSIVAYTGMDYQAGTTDLHDVAKDLQDAINEAINQAMGTREKTYILVRVDSEVGTGNDRLVVYDLEGKGIQFDATSTNNVLGLSNTVLDYRDSVQTTLYADTLDALKSLMDSYLISGVTFNASSLNTGDIEILRDATLNIQNPTPTYLYGGSGVSSGSGINLDAYLPDAGFSESVDDSLNGTFTINGVKITIDDYTKLTVRDVLAKINGSGAGVIAEYDAENDRFVLRSVEDGGQIEIGSPDDTSSLFKVFKLTADQGAIKVQGSSGGKIDPTAPLAESGLSVTPTSGVFTINGVSIYVDVTKDSLNDVMEKVNKSGAGIRMSYDSAQDKVVVISEPDEDGTNGKFIQFGSDNDTSNLLYALNLVKSQNDPIELGSKEQDAVIEVDGLTYVRPTNTIDDVIGGVTLNLNGTSDSYVTLSINPDEDYIIDKFADFIAKYNALVKKLNPPELSDQEKAFLKPLTDEDKQSMTEEEIKEYEEKHKEYLSYEIIRTSPELRSFLSQLRYTVFSTVKGLSPYDDLTDIGITTDFFGTYDSELSGYLLTDSTDKDEIKDLLKQNDKFMDAVRNYTEDLYKLMAINEGDKKGIARKLSEVVDMYFGVSGAVFSYIKPGGYLDRELKEIYSEMSQQQEMISEYEDELWQKFSMMDETISRLQAGYQYMITQLGMSGGTNTK